jgi:MFS family permease
VNVVSTSVGRFREVMEDVRGPLRSREYRLFLAAQVGSFAGTSVATIALAFTALQLGGSVALSAVLACAAIPEVLFLVVGGSLADRLDKRAILVAGNLFSGAAQLCAAILLLSGIATTWHLAIVAVAGGIARAWMQPAAQAAVRQIISPESFQPALALQRLLQNTLRVGGPALGGLLLVLVDSGWALAIDAASFLLAAALISRLRPIQGKRLPAGLLTDLRDGWFDFWSLRWLVILVVQGSVALLFWLAGFQLLGPMYAVKELGGAGPWGVVLGCFAVGLISGSLVAAVVRPRRVGVTSSAGVAGLFLPILAMATRCPLVVICISVVLAGILLDLSVVVQGSFTQRNIPAEIFGRVIAYVMIGELGLVPLGYLAFGSLVVFAGLDVTLWICAVAILLSAVIPLLVREIRDLGYADSRGAQVKSAERAEVT